jgi:hypothetical protein
MPLIADTLGEFSPPCIDRANLLKLALESLCV